MKTFFEEATQKKGEARRQKASDQVSARAMSKQNEEQDQTIKPLDPDIPNYRLRNDRGITDDYEVKEKKRTTMIKYHMKDLNLF
ncbi:ABC transporter ATP-binding protein [Caenorhabditis elegans]|uniref:ABC transporter ATP-binding protein n=1 Tax=Caenorhabditis elegans TaxID=6239 RepID=Q23504_CAEEL|nr:ABC transporter ATP-binding protein [Caenorhabditis elegans]CCD69108.1 ABC transporter ATP-binding protein [Caenorhabditis elegans]|eukprot:NP_508703.1 Uncharacterized protein CELE_ZK470.4 [Caenorhabditis elegans]